MSLHISWLNNFPAVAALLYRHSATARVLGGSPDIEDEFISAVESRERSSQSFRGIPSLFSSPFEAEEPNSFRGMKNYYKTNELPLRKSPFAPPPDRTVSFTQTDDEIDFERSRRVDPEDDILLKQNNELFALFSGDSELRDAFISGDYLKIEKKLARAAKDKLGWSPDISEDFLRRHPTEALVSTANLGGAADSLANSDAAEALTGNVRQRLEDEVFDQLAEKVSGLMKDSRELDESFFRQHPKVALYLLEHPEERRRIDDELEAQKEFKRHVTSYEDRVDPVVKAQALAGSNPTLDEDFWRDNPELSLMLYAEKATGSTNSFQLSSLGLDVDPHTGTTPGEVIAEDQARRALKILGEDTPLNMDYLSGNSHLARWVNENQDFGERLSEDLEVNQYLDNENVKTRRVLQAYVSGFSGRDKSHWHWWA